MAVRPRNGLGSNGGPAQYPPGGHYRMQQLPAHNINGDDTATEIYRPNTPQSRVNSGSYTTMTTPGNSGRPASSMGQHRFRPVLDNDIDNGLCARAPEFYPHDWPYQDDVGRCEDPNAFVDQMASISLGPGLGRGGGPSGPGGYIDNPGQGRFPINGGGGGSRPTSSAGNSRAMVPFISNDARVGAGLMGSAPYGQAVPPNRPQSSFGPGQYDNRTMIPRPHPSMSRGPVYGSINDDLQRYRLAFRDVWTAARSFVANWVVQEGSQVDRNAGIMQYLPRCYSGFTEQQAWSYIRQHLQDDLSRCCLFARVVIDFICQRIMVPSAWQGFDFQADCRIRQLEDEKNIGPSESTIPRNLRFP